MYTLICGSPKVNSSNSLYFLNNIKKELDEYKIHELKKSKYDEIINDISISDGIVFAFPLYVDSPPSIVLKFLDYIIDNQINLNKKLVYVVINCGFREGEQNITGVNIMKNWCKKVDAKYNGSILIGAGEIVGKTKYKLVSKKALKQLSYFSKRIKSKQNSEDIITTMDYLNNRIYCYLANINWNKSCKKHNLSKEEIIAK